MKIAYIDWQLFMISEGDSYYADNHTLRVYFDSLPLKVYLINITPYGRKTLLRRVFFILPII